MWSPFSSLFSAFVMWPSWLSSPSRIATAPPRSPTSRNFSCSSFKDIQKLITEDSNSESISLAQSPSLLRRIQMSTSVLRPFAAAPHRCETSVTTPKPSLRLLNSDQRITIYFTSLGVVHKTFEDCKYALSVLRSFGVPIDERDLWMDGEFLEELRAITGKNKPSLPCVFIDGEFIGGAEEIQQLYERVELKRLVRRIPISTSVLRALAAAPHRCETSITTPKPSLRLPHSDQRITIYFTRLRVVRKTFEDCKYVRSVLRSFGVQIDERDLSMDAKFLEELQAITGKKKPSLPCVFISGEFIGGAEEIRQLHESGELKRLVRDLPVIGSNVCGLCRGLSYIVCDQCDGSHKIYSLISGFGSCNECNVNGLIGCPECSSVCTASTMKQRWMI